MCDGLQANDCKIISLAEFESTLNDQLAKLDDQFAVINDILQAKKEAFIKLYRKDPWVSQDEAVERLRETLESFNPMNPREIPELEAVGTVETAPITESKQTIICDSFSDDNYNVTVSSCKRTVSNDDWHPGYCFLNHPKIQKNQILKWHLRVPKLKYSEIGMVIFLE